MGVETVAIGMAIGAAVGAIGGATVGGGGDAIWKGALTGAVAGAVTGGVGSWAGAAGYSAVAAGAMAGGAGGVTGGLLNAALNGGNRESYLKGGLFGGLGGAALGAAGGYLSPGAEGAVNGELATPTTTPLDMTTATSVEGPTVPIQDISSGMGGANVNAAATVDPTLAAPTPAVTTPTLDAGTQPLQFASNQTTTDVPLGMQTEPQLLPGGVPLNTPAAPEFGADISYSGPHVPSAGGGAKDTFNLADSYVNNKDLGAIYNTTGETNFTFDDYPSQAMIDKGTANPMETSSVAESPAFKWDTFKDNISKGLKMDGSLGNYLKLAGYGQLASGLMKTAGAAATAPETKQNRQQLMDLYNTQLNQMNTQANAANQYQQNLQSTYDNPEAYLSSPEAQASRQLAMQKLLAQNAAAGRRTAGLSMQNQLMMNQLSNLANYRRGLQGNIQYPNYAPAATTLNYAQQYSPTADIMGGLSSAVTPLSLYSLFGPSA